MIADGFESSPARNGCGVPRRSAGCRHHAAHAGVGGPGISQLLLAGRARARRARRGGRSRTLAESGRRAHLHRAGTWSRGSKCGAAIPRIADRGAARSHALGMAHDGRLVRRGRAGLHAPAEPRHTRRHPGELEVRARGARRRGLGRIVEPASPVRDGPAGALLPPPPLPHLRTGAARAELDDHALPLQGPGPVLVGARRRRDARRRGLVLPDAPAGESEDRGPLRVL